MTPISLDSLSPEELAETQSRVDAMTDEQRNKLCLRAVAMASRYWEDRPENPLFEPPAEFIMNVRALIEP